MEAIYNYTNDMAYNIVCACVEHFGRLVVLANGYYVTGFWKTDRNVTLGLFHFIGPANAYTHTLHIRTAIIRLG